MRLKIPRGAPPLLFVALLLVVSFGCKKNKNPQGHILEYGTDKPIEGATVTLSECEGQVLGSFNCSSVATTLTDEDGYFCFDNDGFAFTAKAPGYWDMDDAAIFDINSSRPVPKTVYLYPYAWISVLLRNESGSYGFGSADLFGVISPRVYLQKNETLEKTIITRGSQKGDLLFYILLDENTSLLDLSKVKVFDRENKELPLNTDKSLCKVNLTLGSHDTTKITIIY